MEYKVYGDDNRMSEVKKRLCSRDCGVRPCYVFAPAVRIGLAEVNMLDYGAKVYAGGVQNVARQALLDKEITVYDYNSSAEFSLKNAEYTAESTLTVLLNKLNTQLADNSILLIGFGRCGRAIAKYLYGLNANFTVMTSSPTYAGLYTRAVGYDYITLDEFDVIINTAPAKVIADNCLEFLKKEVIIIDIASEPYGLDHSIAKELGYDSAVYPALPAIHRSVSAADSIVNFIISTEGNDD